jgi:prolyl oligopeptidase PreP (S9A serine peptidase family)
MKEDSMVDGLGKHVTNGAAFAAAMKEVMGSEGKPIDWGKAGLDPETAKQMEKNTSTDKDVVLVGLKAVTDGLKGKERKEAMEAYLKIVADQAGNNNGTTEKEEAEHLMKDILGAVPSGPISNGAIPAGGTKA